MMNREIKFRAYIKSLKLIVPVTLICYRTNTIHVDMNDNADDWEYDFDDVVLMQNTGLRDRNGKEIYEGDVLLFHNTHTNAKKRNWVCKVEYREGGFVCEYPRDGVYNHFDAWNYPLVTWKVIGNIYEDGEG